jgi:hypothetical protein
MRHTIQQILAASMLAAAAWAQTPPPATGQIGGVVIGSDQKPVSDIFVSYVRAQTDASDPTPSGGGAMTGADGVFQFPKLTPGTYLFCARAVPSRQIVEFCEWTFHPPSVVLKAGQMVGGLQILVKKGARLELQIDDAKKVLPDPEDPKPDTSFHIGVRTSEGLFHEAQLTTRDHGGQVYYLIVPFNTPLRLDASIQNVDLSDDKGGEPGKNGPGGVFQIDPKTPVLSLKFSVDSSKGK